MRFHTGVTATRTTPPTITTFQPPNPAHPPELHISFGGLSVWLTMDEAKVLGERLISAAERPPDG